MKIILGSFGPRFTAGFPSRKFGKFPESFQVALKIVNSEENPPLSTERLEYDPLFC